MSHIGSFPTVDLGENRVLWFGMSVASPDALRAVRERTVVTAEVPETDGRRRTDTFIRARDGVVFNTILFNTTYRKLIIPSFAHFPVNDFRTKVLWQISIEQTGVAA